MKNRSRKQLLGCAFAFSAMICFSLLGFSQPDSIRHTFIYYSNNAGSVSIAGSFNNWNPSGNQFLKINDSTWTLQLLLKPDFYYYKLVVDGNWIPDPSHNWKINDGGNSFNTIVKVGNPEKPKRQSTSRPFPKDKLPKPIVSNNPEYVELYYAAWEMAWQKIQTGTPQNGFSESYMDEGFNELIYQWDTCFMTAFGVYGRDIFPAMASLDNFYKKQRKDGYIQRVYWETNGETANEPTPDEPMINPPLFAWLEWRYFQISGDRSRLKNVQPVLVRYYEWIEKNCSSINNDGTFYATPLGSGMDNTPRENCDQAGYIDITAQMALSAKFISTIANELQDKNLTTRFDEKYNSVSAVINHKMWNKKSQFYFDVTRNQTQSDTKHIGAFWTMLSNVADSSKLQSLVRHLENKSEFNRPHRVPTLSADDPHYDAKGHYWLGSVWAPTNYMVIKGLENTGFQKLADEISDNHLTMMVDVYNNFKPDENKLDFDERYGDNYKTIWECYSSELNEPATRWDNTFYSRQDFVGWSGLAPIALLIENIIGLKIEGAMNKIEWRIRRNDVHGIENIRLGNQLVSLVYNSGKVEVQAESGFTLVVISGNRRSEIRIQSGKHFYTL